MVIVNATEQWLYTISECVRKWRSGGSADHMRRPEYLFVTWYFFLRVKTSDTTHTPVVEWKDVMITIDTQSHCIMTQYTMFGWMNNLNQSSYPVHSVPYRAIIMTENSYFFSITSLISWAHVVKNSARESHVIILKMKNKIFWGGWTKLLESGVIEFWTIINQQHEFLKALDSFLRFILFLNNLFCKNAAKKTFHLVLC